MFTCIDGPQRAMFEFPIARDEQPPVGVAMGRVVYQPYVRVVYTTVRVAQIGEGDYVQPVLCGWVLNHMRALLTDEQREDRSTILFWRKRPMVEEFLDKQGRICTALRMRLAIPGIDLAHLTTPESETRWL